MVLTDEQFTKAMKALSEPNRLEIIRLVTQKQGTCGVTCAEVLAQLGISQSTFSHHVTELRDAEILVGVPEGRTVKLSINHELLNLVKEKISSLA
ncbi:MAG TPA: metalloregulator ArsR/SmtB family transcription factor [Fimbriimonas sp.]|nr:metalloregulator ArsR/SmtB family transcription factor [Fimbriimonas sp.]